MINVLNIKYLFSLSLLLFVVIIGYSQQEHAYHHYTVEDGLPSSEVYSAFQDSKGYMWFATDAGVSRFNGYEFENFDVSDGLTDNTVFLITEDHKGRIWFGTFNCQLSYYDDGKIHQYKYNDRIKKVIRGTIDVRSFAVDKDDNIWMGFRSEGIYRCSKNGKVEQLLNLSNENTLIKSFELNNGKHVSGSIATKSDNYDVIIETPSKVSSHFIQQEFKKELKSSNINPIYYNKGLIFEYYNKWYHLKEGENKLNQIISPFNDSVYFFSMYGDEKFLWVCIQNEGAYKCEVKNDSLKIIDTFLEGKSVSRVFKDKEESYWFQTLNEGIYYLTAKEIKYKESNKHAIIAIEIDTISGSLYLATYGREILKAALDSSIIKYNTISKLTQKSYCLTYNYSDSSLFYGACKQGEYLMFRKNNTDFSLKEAEVGSSKDLIVDGNYIYTVNSFGISIVRDNKLIYNSINAGEPKMWCTSILSDKGKLWIGTRDGIKFYTNEKITTPYEDNLYLSSSITSIIALNKEVIMVGTKGYGVIVIKNGNIYEIIDQKKGLVANFVRKIYVDNDKTIWVGTTRGISRLQYSDSGEYKIYNLTRKQGLPSTEIIDINSYKNNIYVATAKGLIFFNKNKIRKTENQIKSIITDFKVNHIKRPVQKEINLSHDENNITISFLALNYRSLGQIEYHYRLLGVDNEWQNTTIRQLTYSTLQPGEYTFKVKAKNENGAFGNAASLNFFIKPPFYKTWWFIISCIVFMITIIAISFKVNILAYNKHIQQELLKRLLKKLGKQNYLLIEVNKQQIRINQSKILFVQSFRNYVEINTTGKKYTYRSTMNDMEKQLSSINFVRTHRSFIVQKDKIDSISETKLIIQQHEIPIGKTYQKSLKALKEQFSSLNA